MKNTNLILNPYFLIGLVVLLLNDFYFKYEYGNFVTGKLSDFAGLLIFPMFIVFLIPKLKKSASWIVGIAFIIWKTPLADPIISTINQFSPFFMLRTVDYSDYMALLILPLSHYLINYYNYKPINIKSKKLIYSSKYLVLVIAVFAFCATQMPRPYEMPKGTIYIGKSYKIKLPKDSIIKTIKQLGYNCTFHPKDSIRVNEKSYINLGSMEYYQTDDIVRYNYWNNDSTVLDTIANIKYQLIELKPNKTKLTIINVTLSEEGNLQDWKKLKGVSKQYEKWLKKNLIEKID